MGRADFQETAGSNIITNLEIGAILSFSPCIIHIENFDMVFNDPAQQHNSLPEDSLDEIFGAALVSFIKDLNDEIDANTQKARSNKFDTIVVVVVSTKYGSKIKPSLRSVFGSEIQISGSNLKAKEYLGSIHSRLGSDVLLHAEAEQVLVSHMEAHNMGETAVGQFLSEVKLTALARQKFSMWMDSISPACSAVLSTPRRNVRVAAESSASQIDASSNIMLTITAGDVQRTIWEMPCMNGFDTTNGSNGRAQQQHKQATIAPVHWADIGGLDRYVLLFQFTVFIFVEFTHCADRNK